jgi:hypothetical protein
VANAGCGRQFREAVTDGNQVNRGYRVAAEA